MYALSPRLPTNARLGHSPRRLLYACTLVCSSCFGSSVEAKPGAACSATRTAGLVATAPCLLQIQLFGAQVVSSHLQQALAARPLSKKDDPTKLQPDEAPSGGAPSQEDDVSAVLEDDGTAEKIDAALSMAADQGASDPLATADAADVVAEVVTDAVVVGKGKAVESAHTELKSEGNTTSAPTLAVNVSDSAASLGALREDPFKDVTSDKLMAKSAAVGAGTVGKDFLMHKRAVGFAKDDNNSFGRAEMDEKALEVQEEIAEKVEQVINEKVDEARQQHRKPTEQELHAAVDSELKGILDHLLHARRFQPARPNGGIREFFGSVACFDWLLLSGAIVAFFFLYRIMLHWPSENQYHWLGLLVWFAMALLYFFLITLRQGFDDGLSWVEGYLLELIFLIENVFVFHIVVSGFASPRRNTESALFVVLVCQVVFQLVFYMGLAHWLRSLYVLPYLLGVWLIYVGFHSATTEGEGAIDFNNSSAIRTMKAVLGDRLALNGMHDSELLTYKERKRCLTQTGLMVLCLLAVDFLLEVDVTVTKIETLPNQYIAFSSSVVATFALPELFFIARDIFKRFRGLKYGISCVLLLFGLEMLLHEVVQVPALYSIAALIFVMAASGVLSLFMYDEVEEQSVLPSAGNRRSTAASSSSTPASGGAT